MSTIGVVALLVGVAASVVIGIAGMWKAFSKAGIPGWGAVVPLYNFYLMWKLADARKLVLLALFTPFVSLFAVAYLCVRIAKGFGRSSAFGVGLLLGGPLFWAVLGFGKAEWIGLESGEELARERMRRASPRQPGAGC